MKKVFLFCLVFLLVIALSSSVSLADKPLIKLKGKHWQFNIIGHPKNVNAISGDHSRGRAIMVPLKNANGPGLESIVCEEDESVVTPDEAPTWTNQEPKGAKIHFVAGDDFEVIDRDATDGNGATVMIPTWIVPNNSVQDDPETNPYDRVIAVDIWVRVLGKPMTCMDIDGYAYDLEQAVWFWSGSVDLNRKHGRSSWVDVRELFDVWFCQIDFADVDQDGNTNECVEGTEVEISVFDNVFEDYFWNILNDGTRIVQVRLYPRTQL